MARIRKLYYAHSMEGRPVSEWRLLEDHLACPIICGKSSDVQSRDGGVVVSRNWLEVFDK